MTEAEPSWDVIICGGGMAGLTLARQLRRELPALRVAVAERTQRPIAATCHKVGESNAELGSQYLERLGLRDYLEREHLVKLGLRFFPGGGRLPFERRTEIGPGLEPVVRGYQIDRGRFEHDLRGMIEADGVTLWEGARVRDIEFGDGANHHHVLVEQDGKSTRYATRWVVDATGRSGLFARRQGTKQPPTHMGSASWFRIEGHIHLEELLTDPSPQWQGAPLATQRWRSTNHLMGAGYWVWLIALSTGRMSIGVVIVGDTYGFDRIHTLPRVLEFLDEHEPALADRLARADVLDFRCMKNYSYGVQRSWSADRWAIVGEAGAFADPLYSPGTDFIALSNSFTVELIREDVAGDGTGTDAANREALALRASALDAQYQAHIEGTLGVYRMAAPVYAHARAMANKAYWDNFAYWSYTCQYFLRGLYRTEPGGAFERAVATVRDRFIELSGYVQALLHAWASMHPEDPCGGFRNTPPFPSLSVDAHLALERDMSHDEALSLMQQRMHEGEQMVAEFVVRALLEFGPASGAAMLQAAAIPRGALPLNPARAEGELTVGLQRRRTLSKVTRDVERALGRVERHPLWQEALVQLFGELPRASPV